MANNESTAGSNNETKVRKRKQTSALSLLTRKRNEVFKLLGSSENLHLVKDKITETDALFEDYRIAHENLMSILSNEE